MSTHQSRSIARSLALVPFAVALLTMALAFTNAGAALQIDPTAEPGTRIQANPTSTPNLPIRVSPTEPPPREPDDVQVNPTEPPPRVPDDVQANPTQVPSIDDEAIPTTGTVRVVKRDCPAGVPVDALLTDYLEICTQPHDGVEFVVNDVDGAQVGVTSGGQVEWTGVDSGVFNITETIPAGYGDPIVFCGYTESPGGGVQHPAIQEAAGGVVAGTFPDAMFEFVCYWMNVPTTPGIDDLQDIPPSNAHIVTATKLACPEGVEPTGDYWQNIAICPEEVEGVGFSLTTESDTVEGVSDAGGGVIWTDVDLGDSGEIQIQEAIPDGYGEPTVMCTSFPEAAADPFDYEFFEYPADDGLITASPEQHEPYRFGCVFFNVLDDNPGQGQGQGQGNPGQGQGQGQGQGNPGQGQGNQDTGLVRVEKRSCPPGIVLTATLSEYLELCPQVHDGVDFTLNHNDGADNGTTSGGTIEWDGVPLGDVTIQETIPVGYLDPLVFCGFTESPGGGVQHPSLQPSTGGQVSGALEVDGAEWVCYWLNIKSGDGGGFEGPGDVANPESGDADSTVTVHKHTCPEGVGSGLNLYEYRQQCAEPGNGVPFTLANADGESTHPISGGVAEWDGLPLGNFTIQEVPAAFGDPVVFCSWTAFHDGAVYDSFAQLVPAPGGLIEREIVIPNTSMLCEFFNLQPESVGFTGTQGAMEGRLA